MFTFCIDRPEDVKFTFKKLNELIKQHKGKLDGDDTQGFISIHGVEGTYTVSENTIEITITKKPSIIQHRK